MKYSVSDDFIIEKIKHIEFWEKVPPLQCNKLLWKKIIEENIPTKVDCKTGILMYKSGTFDYIGDGFPPDGFSYDSINMFDLKNEFDVLNKHLK